MENVEFWPIWDRHFSWFFPFYAAYPADLVASAGASHWWSLICPTRRLLGPSDTICHSTHRVYNEQCLSSLRGVIVLPRQSQMTFALVLTRSRTLSRWVAAGMLPIKQLNHTTSYRRSSPLTLSKPKRKPGNIRPRSTGKYSMPLKGTERKRSRTNQVGQNQITQLERQCWPNKLRIRRNNNFCQFFNCKKFQYSFVPRKVSC